MKSSKRKDKKKKKDKSVIEAELFAMMTKGLRVCLDQALNDIFGDFNRNYGGTLHF